MRAFFLTHAETPQALQEIATLIRTLAEIPRLVTYKAPRAVTLRGTADQAALAEWLVNELDKPADRLPLAQREDVATHQYRMPGSRDDVVRVFYLTHTETPQGLQEIATLVRSTAGIRRLLTYNAPRALALRGTLDQIALAERLIEQRDKR